MKVQYIPSVRNARKTKVAAYVRVSSTMYSQDESFEEQCEYYEKFIRSNPEWEFVGIYGERLSGTKSENRPEFMRLIEDALGMKVDLIYCKSISRWSRNTIDALKSIQRLNGNNVHIVFEQEGIDTRNPGVIMQLSLTASVAQRESESISENLRWVYRNRASKGIFVATKGVYFGYNTDDHEFRPDENAKYVKMIFKRYAEGASLSEICRELASYDVRTIKGNLFKPFAVRNILRNEVYVGDVRLGKASRHKEDMEGGYLSDHHEGIVDRTTWDCAQKRISKQKNIKNTKKLLDIDDRDV